MNLESVKEKTIRMDNTIYEAAWKYLKKGGTIYVVDNEFNFIGAVGRKEINQTFYNSDLNIGEIVNKQCKRIDFNDNYNLVYEKAAAIFALNPNVDDIPVIKSGKIYDIMTRERVFFLDYLNKKKHRRPHYAQCIWQAANEAKMLGIKKISAIEFGVAGGNGLIILETYAKEVARLLNIEIEVYGFDTGCGLPEYNEGYKDLLHWWSSGTHCMDFDSLQKRLDIAQLVIGNVEDTLTDFSSKYNPAIVGCMCIDVDYYSSTVPIMKFLEGENALFLPRIYMYFDDTNLKYEYSGETLAIKEFNARNEMCKISPELTFDFESKMKICHRFDHPLYNYRIIKENVDLRLK